MLWLWLCLLAVQLLDLMVGRWGVLLLILLLRVVASHAERVISVLHVLRFQKHVGVSQARAGRVKRTRWFMLIEVQGGCEAGAAWIQVIAAVLSLGRIP